MDWNGIPFLKIFEYVRNGESQEAAAGIKSNAKANLFWLIILFSSNYSFMKHSNSVYRKIHQQQS